MKMNNSVGQLIEFEHVNLVDTSLETEQSLKAAIVEATDYLLFYNWVERINKIYVGEYFEGILGIFLFNIEPKLFGVDDYTWVIVGDLPSAYVTVEDSPNPACALDGYIGAVEQWTAAVFEGKSLQNLIPVNAEPTISNAKQLERRLEFLDQEIMPRCKGLLHPTTLN